MILLSATIAQTVYSHPGWGMVEFENGTIAFTDLFNSRITLVDTDGDIEHLTNHRFHTHDMSLTPDGSLLAENRDYYNNHPRMVLYEISHDGAVEIVDGPYDTEKEIFGYLRDHNGNYYGTTHFDKQTSYRVIFKWDTQGKRTILAGGGQPYTDGQGVEAGFYRISGMTWGADSTIYVADGESVRKISLTGDVTTLLKDSELLGHHKHEFYTGTRRNHLYGINVNINGTVLVANYAMKTIIEIPPQNSRKKAGVIYTSTEGFSPVNALHQNEKLIVLESPALTSSINLGMRLVEYHIHLDQKRIVSP
ncbi:hypothetical protein K8I28_06400 [bacterium]|nr:hypothetical protein [bacterium]